MYGTSLLASYTNYLENYLENATPLDSIKDDVSVRSMVKGPPTEAVVITSLNFHSELISHALVRDTFRRVLLLKVANV